jgi:uncharacterized protein YxeA
MKKFLFLLSFVVLIVSNSNAQFGKKKEEKKEETAVIEEEKDGKKKETLTPHKATGVYSVDNLGYTSYNLAKATDSLQKEAMFLRIDTKEVQDPKLGTVTEVKCYNSAGEEIPCQKLDKQESKRKFESILMSLGDVSKQIPSLVALIPSATNEVTSMSSNPMKAVTASKASASLKNIGTLLSTTGTNAAALTVNLNAAIKNLELIKKQ